MTREQMRVVEATAAKLAAAPLARSRELLSLILDEPKLLTGTDPFTQARRTAALAFNAHLCTRLRERDARIWGLA